MRKLRLLWMKFELYCKNRANAKLNFLERKNDFILYGAFFFECKTFVILMIHETSSQVLFILRAWSPSAQTIVWVVITEHKSNKQSELFQYQRYTGLCTKWNTSQKDSRFSYIMFLCWNNEPTWIASLCASVQNTFAGVHFINIAWTIRIRLVTIGYKHKK